MARMPTKVRANDPTNSATKAAPSRTGIGSLLSAKAVQPSTLTQVLDLTQLAPPQAPRRSTAFAADTSHRDFVHFFPNILCGYRTSPLTYRISCVTILLPW